MSKQPGFKLVWLAACAMVAVAAIACSSSPKSSSTPTAAPAAAATTQPTATASAAATATSTGGGATAAASTVKIGNSTLGQVLTNPAGLTLYTYNKDVANSGQSTVSGGLLTAWPALIVTSATTVPPAGLTGSLGVITRAEGTMQVTYKGLPLYLWSGDKAAGDVTGQGVAGFTIATP